jgi:hypothetical protein
MKRVLITSMFVSVLGIAGFSHAGCDGPGVAAGDHGEATVTFADADGHSVNIHTSAFGNFAAGPVQACADGTIPHLVPTTGFVTVTVDDTAVCTNTSSPPAFDPFIFGGGVHDATTDVCGADVTWDGLSWLISPSAPPGLPEPLAIGAGPDGVHAGDEQPAIVTGSYWYDGVTYTVPDGIVGWFSNHGAEAAVYG